MRLRRAALITTVAGLAATLLGVILLLTAGPGVPLVVLAQPVLVVAAALWLAYFVERQRDKPRA
jgi:membrane protein implicated in regulation of membrane protease activity